MKLFNIKCNGSVEAACVHENLFGGNFMKKIIGVLLVILGALGTLIGLIPYVINFPYTTSSENSGPKNYWELIIYIAYDGWYLQIGIVMIIVGFLLLYKFRKNTTGNKIVLK